jgi:hypothetical protein
MHSLSTRRLILKQGVALAALTSPFGAPFSVAGIEPAERIDVHGHIPPQGLRLEEILRLMDHAGISKMVLMPRGPVPSSAAFDMFQAAPNRIIPFLGTMNTAWHKGDYKVLRYAEKALSTGIYKGVGELMVRYFGNEKLGEMDVDRPADSSFILDLADICAQFDCVMQIHMEPEQDKIESLERLLVAKPKTNIIWAHFGSVTNRRYSQFASLYRGDAPFFLDHLLRQYPNLYTDLSGVQDTNRVFIRGYNLRRQIPLYESSGRLMPVFAECIRRNQLKILWGLDTPYIQNWSEKPLKLWVDTDEKMLAQLSNQELRDNIMFRNAERLLGA